MNTTDNFHNVTYLEDDIFDENAQHTNSTSEYSFKFFIKLILHLFSLLGVVLIAYTLHKFKRFKSDEDRIIFHWALVNIILHVAGPTLHIIFYKWSNLNRVPCFVVEIIIGLLMTGFFFAFGLYTYWVLSNIKLKILSKYEEYFKAYCVHILYLFAFVHIFLSIIFCTLLDIFISDKAAETVFIVMILLNCIKYFCITPNQETLKTAYTTVVANAMVLTFLPLFVYHYVFRVYLQNHQITVLFILELIGNSNTLFAFFILWKYDMDFKTGIMITLKRFVECKRRASGWNELLVDDVRIESTTI